LNSNGIGVTVISSSDVGIITSLFSKSYITWFGFDSSLSQYSVSSSVGVGVGVGVSVLVGVGVGVGVSVLVGVGVGVSLLVGVGVSSFFFLQFQYHL
jgi:hypothetical protein